MASGNYDVRHQLHVTELQSCGKFSNSLVRWSIRMVRAKITKLCLNLSRLCLEYRRLFFPDTV